MLRIAWALGGAVDLKLNELCEPTYWASLSDDTTTRITIVVPSGRAQMSKTSHLALSTDMLYIPEIVLKIDSLSRRADLSGVSVQTMLDIDFYELNASSDTAFKAENLICLGTADVNLAVDLLLEEAKSIETYGAGFEKPYDNVAAILGAGGTHYNANKFVRAGALILYKNPWSDEAQPRLAILCAGLLAIGTAAASRLLLDYLQGKRHGNNDFSPDVPLKIVDGVGQKYKWIQLRPQEECEPPMDVRNISGFKILE